MIQASLYEQDLFIKKQNAYVCLLSDTKIIIFMIDVLVRREEDKCVVKTTFLSFVLFSKGIVLRIS